MRVANTGARHERSAIVEQFDGRYHAEAVYDRIDCNCEDVMTPREKRQAVAKRLEKLLPAKPTKAGATTIKDSELKRAITALQK